MVAAKFSTAPGKTYSRRKKFLRAEGIGVQSYTEISPVVRIILPLALTRKFRKIALLPFDRGSFFFVQSSAALVLHRDFNYFIAAGRNFPLGVSMVVARLVTRLSFPFGLFTPAFVTLSERSRRGVTGCHSQGVRTTRARRTIFHLSIHRVFSFFFLLSYLPSCHLQSVTPIGQEQITLLRGVKRTGHKSCEFLILSEHSGEA